MEGNKIIYNLKADKCHWDEIIERKIRYNSEVVEYKCNLLNAQDKNVVLFHLIEEPFTMEAEQNQLTIPKGSYTIAYYWEERPYNIYLWRDHNGKYLGSYFNIVKNTSITDKMVTFEDLIIDILAFPNGEYYILDEDELPKTLEKFENGSVQQSLNLLIESMNDILSQVISESQSIYKHEVFVPFLDKYMNRSI